MKKVKAIGVFASFSIAIVLGFQNCSGMKGANYNESSASSVAPPSQDPQTALSSAQLQLSQVLGSSPSTTQELQAALQALQNLLAEIQAINTSNLPPALQQLAQQLIQQLTGDIAQLQVQIVQQGNPPPPAGNPPPPPPPPVNNPPPPVNNPPPPPNQQTVSCAMQDATIVSLFSEALGSCGDSQAVQITAQDKISYTGTVDNCRKFCESFNQVGGCNFFGGKYGNLCIFLPRSAVVAVTECTYSPGFEPVVPNVNSVSGGLCQ